MDNWWLATASAIVAGIISSLTVILIQVALSPRSERQVGSVNIETNVHVIEARIVQANTSADSNGNYRFGFVAVAGALALVAFYWLLKIIAGIILGSAIATLLILILCVVRAQRLHLWTAQAWVVLSYGLIALLIVGYAWWLIFFYSSNEMTALQISERINAKGSGNLFLPSLFRSSFAAIGEPESLKFAAGILAAVVLSAALLSMTLVFLFRWVAYISIAYSAPRRFAKVRANAAAHFLHLKWQELPVALLVAAMAVFLSPPVFYDLLA